MWKLESAAIKPVVINNEIKITNIIFCTVVVDGALMNSTINNVGINLYKNFLIASFFVSLLPRDTISVVF